MYSRKEIWRISLPILVSLFVQNLINITDTAFMGRVGQVELGASALAGVLYLAFYMVTFGFLFAKPFQQPQQGKYVRPCRRL